MNQVPISVPVFIERFAESNEADRYTKAKLKVFYVGETADHRLFTKDFSDKVKETLPLTPVVAYYSESKDDFVGHNATQYIYGVVPDGADISYEKDEDNGFTYLVTDVILYTERKDNISEIANKIIGKQHSLELNPDTLKYKINRDSQGRFMNVEFLEGQFIGLSVLGDNETPAFAGAGFFALDPNMAEQCKEKFNKFIDILNHNGGSIEVFDYQNYFNNVHAKFAVTMQDFIEKIYSALEAQNIYGYVIENTDSYAIVRYWSEEANKCVNMKYAISLQNDEIVLGDAEEVFVKYLTQSEVDAVNTANANAAATDSSEDGEGGCGNYATDSSDDADSSNDTTSDSSADSFADGSNDSSADDDGQEGAGDNESLSNHENEETQETTTVGAATASASATTLTDSEREELEHYRKQEKIAVINEYRNDLENELLDRYIAECDNFTKDEIEAKLAIEYRKFSKTHPKDDKNTQITAFSFIAKTEAGYDETDPAQVINKYAKNK